MKTQFTMPRTLKKCANLRKSKKRYFKWEKKRYIKKNLPPFETYILI